MSFAQMLFETAAAIQNAIPTEKERLSVRSTSHEKYCGHCKEVKDKSCFYKRSNGYCVPYCKECTSKREVLRQQKRRAEREQQNQCND